jgi:phosphoglycerate dehydrogenase-like enzyme
VVVEADVAEACKSGQLGGYCRGRIWITNRPRRGHPFNEIDNIIITPHVGCGRSSPSSARRCGDAQHRELPQRRQGLHPGEFRSNLLRETPMADNAIADIG